MGRALPEKFGIDPNFCLQKPAKHKKKKHKKEEKPKDKKKSKKKPPVNDGVEEPLENGALNEEPLPVRGTSLASHWPWSRRGKTEPSLGASCGSSGTRSGGLVASGA